MWGLTDHSLSRSAELKNEQIKLLLLPCLGLIVLLPTPGKRPQAKSQWTLDKGLLTMQHCGTKKLLYYQQCANIKQNICEGARMVERSRTSVLDRRGRGSGPGFESPSGQILFGSSCLVCGINNNIGPIQYFVFFCI